jgi:hypothetical protein
VVLNVHIYGSVGGPVHVLLYFMEEVFDLATGKQNKPEGDFRRSVKLRV